MDQVSAPSELPKKGISNMTLAVLVLLALIMTVIGALAVLNNVESSKEPVSTGTNVGHVSFVVIPHSQSQGSQDGAASE